MTTEAGHAVDDMGKRLGMWLFLFTEMLFFGGMFLLYSVYRYTYPLDFHHAAQEEKLVIGSINTFILLTSSFTLALAITAVRKGRRGLSILLQGITILCGAVFLVDKYIEWMDKIVIGLYPNSPVLVQRPPGEVLFYGLYYVMTGIHGLHVFIGMGVIAFMVWGTLRGKITPEEPIRLENTGLYWHFVDIVWIYLFPLFYLIT